VDLGIVDGGHGARVPSVLSCDNRYYRYAAIPSNAR
jgi:hypothetical protein